MKRTNFPRYLFLGLALSLMLGTAGCGSDDSPTNPDGGNDDTATATIGTAGGAISVDGGNVRLEFPAGAFTEDVTVTLTRRTGDDVSAEMAALGITETWEMEPAGLALAAPAALTHTLPTAKNTEVGLAAAVQETDDGLIYTSANFDIVLQDGVRKLEGGLSAIGTIGIVDMTFAKGRITGVPVSVPCDGSFTALTEYRLDPEYENMLIESVTWEDRTATVADNAFGFDGSDGVIGASGRELDYSWAGEGDGVISGFMVFTEMQPWVQMPAVSAKLQLAVDSIGEECTGGGGEFTGSRTSPVTLPEALVVIARGWASSPQVEDFLVAVAGGNGWGVLDVATGAVALGEFLNQFRPLFGLVTLASAVNGEKVTNLHEAVIDFGPGGANITTHTSEGWGWSQPFEMQNPVYDATNFTGPLGDTGCVYVASVAVGAVAWSENSQAFVGVGQRLTYGDFAEQFETLVSAVSEGPEDPVLIIEDRADADGRIWLHTRQGVDATVVGSAGGSPRKVRFAGGVAAVSSFDDDLLTIVQWDGAADVTIVGTVAVGDGPVGIDVLDLGNGNVAIVSTGFNDDTYTLTVIDAATGATVSNVTSAVPEGGTAPGHAAWVRDGSRRFAISCNGSDEIVVVDSGL